MRRKVTLTFDNGPTPGVTDHVLQVLDQHGIRATFFVLGNNLRTPHERSLMVAAAARGHWIGNHTFHHEIPFGENPDPLAAEAEIAATQALIGESAHPDRLFRPFGKGGLLGDHLLSPVAVEHLTRGGYTCVLWNVIPEDWINVDHWPEIALAECRTRDWSLVVLHDYDTGAMNQLDSFIRRALADGIEFVQEFPPECVPIRGGTVRLPIDTLVGVPPITTRRSKRHDD